MSIADKLVKVADNIPKVYTAGMFNLANSATDDSLRGVVSGSGSITIADISSVKHLVKTRVEAETEVSMLNDQTKAFSDAISTEITTISWSEYDGRYPNRLYVQTEKDPNERTEYFTIHQLTLKAGTYELKDNYCTTSIELLFPSNSSTKEYIYDEVFTVSEECTCYVKLIVPHHKDASSSGRPTPKLLQYISLQSIPITVTDENGISTEYIPNDDGIVEGVKSTYPTMNITTAKENAVIYAEYVKDIPKVSQEISTKAYNEGHAEGHSEGYTEGLAVNYDEGVNAGKKAEYDRFWDSFQKSGNRRAYRNSFGSGWTDELFKPKYPFGDISDSYMMFAASGIKDIPNLKIVGTSQYCFFNNKVVEHLKEIEVNDDMYGTFSGCSSLVTIDKLIMNYTNTSGNTHTASFNGCSALENIVIEGEIKGNISFQYSPKLSKDSVISIINALSSTASSKILTLSRTAVDNAFETSEGIADGSSSTEWLTLASTKTNWTISLV